VMEWASRRLFAYLWIWWQGRSRRWIQR
jgi:hypothetical protein